MVVTSVRGHLMNYTVPPEYNNWERVDPVKLFDVHVHKTVPEVQSIINCVDLINILLLFLTRTCKNSKKL